MNQIPSTAVPSSTAGGRPAPGQAPPRIAVVCSQWHREIVHRARDSLLAELERHGVGAEQIEQFEVPGAFEIPLHAKRLARGRRHDAIVACGLVVDGGIYRHDFVAHAVIDGLMRVQLETDVPVFSVVLTPQAFHEHVDHRAFFLEHFEKKGIEAAHACLGTLQALQRIGATCQPGPGVPGAARIG